MASRESDHGRWRVDVAGPTALGDAVASVRRFASDRGLGPRDRARLCIVVEELVANLFEHGGCDAGQPIGIEIDRLGYSLALAIEDGGTPFDPRATYDESVVSDGGAGAGLRLIKAWSEIVSYETGGGRNRLKLSIALTDG